MLGAPVGTTEPLRPAGLPVPSRLAQPIQPCTAHHHLPLVSPSHHIPSVSVSPSPCKKQTSVLPATLSRCCRLLTPGPSCPSACRSTRNRLDLATHRRSQNHVTTHSPMGPAAYPSRPRRPSCSVHASHAGLHCSLNSPRNPHPVQPPEGPSKAASHRGQVCTRAAGRPEA